MTPGRLAAAALVGLVALWPRPAAADDDDEAVLEFHFEPVPDLQIAIWLETPGGEFVRDVFVTQATGKLGIGNRPGIWNFLSSWHFPYGPRKNVLPVWAHRRGTTYPEIVFHDDKAAYQDSLGWHESTSSDEPYFCRPLTQAEHDAIVGTDAMSCPSPAAFHSDKGRFADAGATSLYPPRTDITAFDPERDHEDIKGYAAINDLDLVTGATPSGGMPTYQAITVRRGDLPPGPLVAWIEVSLEHDENADWEFDRDADHYVDYKLEEYGIEWLGQPAIAYRVELDPGVEGFYGTDEWTGYADLDGATGTLHAPDQTISTGGGSGADRLGMFEAFGETVRFGVRTTGWMEPGAGCEPTTLPAVEDLALAPVAFNEVRTEFTLPASMPAGTEVTRIKVYRKESRDPLSAEEMVMAGHVDEFLPCFAGQDPAHCFVGRPGDRVSVAVDQLFGDYTYQFGVVYGDRCTNESELRSGSATTPSQKFQQIETLCFVATAAFGAWQPEVAALRAFRDLFLLRFSLGQAFVRTYYAYGPTFAGLIRQRPLLRALTRIVLQPIADTARLTAPPQFSGSLPR